MYINDNVAQVVPQHTLHISDFPPAAAVALQHFIERAELYNHDWANLYFALLIEPDTAEVFPMGKYTTLDFLEQLLRRYAVTMKERNARILAEMAPYRSRSYQR